MEDEQEIFQQYISSGDGGTTLEKGLFSVFIAISLCAFLIPPYFVLNGSYVDVRFLVFAFILSLILTIIGLANSFYYRRNHVPSVFWTRATFFAAIPLFLTLFFLVLGIFSTPQSIFY